MASGRANQRWRRRYYWEQFQCCKLSPSELLRRCCERGSHRASPKSYDNWSVVEGSVSTGPLKSSDVSLVVLPFSKPLRTDRAKRCAACGYDRDLWHRQVADLCLQKGNSHSNNKESRNADLVFNQHYFSLQCLRIGQYFTFTDETILQVWEFLVS